MTGYALTCRQCLRDPRSLIAEEVGCLNCAMLRHRVELAFGRKAVA